MLKRLSFLIISLCTLFSLEAQVNASFTANQTSGCPNPFLLILTSTSTSSGAPIDFWSWTLTGPPGFAAQTSGTNQLSTGLSISGFYNVTLTVCSGGVNGICDTETQNAFIEVFERPSVAATLSPVLGCPPFQTCFDGTFSAGCGTITSTVVDMRDGNVILNQEDFCHVYSNSGTYTGLTATVTNSCGCIRTITLPDVVTVSPAPVANFTTTNSFSCTPPLNVTFTNTSTSTLAGTIYEWNIPPIVNGATTQNLTASFPTGTYDVELIVTNPNGCSDTIIQTAAVVVGNPNADFGSNLTTVCPGGAVSFSDSSSGTPTSYFWTFEGHGTSTSVNPVINFNTIGSWDVSLVVNYSGGCSDTILRPNYITVSPVPVNNFTVSDSSGCAVPFNTTFTSTATNVDSVYWSFPGGTPANFSGFGPVNITYNANGIYGVSMTSFSPGGCSTVTNFANVIDVSPLTANIVIDSVGGCTPVTSTLGFTLSAGEVAANQSWTLPGSDIGVSVLANPTAIYNAVGCYDITLNVSSVSGCTTNVTQASAICVGTPPTGAFSVAPNSVCFDALPVTVAFTGSGADSILWNFGDGSPLVWGDEGQSVNYIYGNDIGDFTITMIAFNNGCSSDTPVAYVDTVQVLGPIAGFNPLFQSCSQWNTFNFFDDSFDADSVFYTFGDPTSTVDTSSSANAQWTYPPDDTVRNYLVTQFAYNFTTGCEHVFSSTISVYPPDADFIYSDSAGCAPLSVTFTNTSLFPGALTNTLWNWDSTYIFSGAGFGVVWGRNPITSRVYSQIGEYDVIMRNVDPRGCRDTVLKSNIIQVHGVIPNFTPSALEGCVPLNVNFTDQSVAPLTGIESWFWDFGNPNTLADTSILENPSYLFDEPGLYVVTLTATDSFGCEESISRTILVNEPLANFSLSLDFVCTNQSVLISDSSIGQNLIYDWQFTNGSPSMSNLSNPLPFTYATEGFQNLFLEVTDSIGCTDDTTLVLPVFDVVADAAASIDTILCFANIIPITFTNNSINNVDSSSVFWDLGNGTSSTLYSPSAIYNVAGTYVVSMSISSNSGCRDTIIVDTIFVGGPFAEIEVLDRDTACLCETIDFALTTWNAGSPIFFPGDGGFVNYIPNGIIGDTIVDTFSHQYCLTGSFLPQIFIDDGTCSGNVVLNDSIRIDSLVADFGVAPITACDSGIVCFFDSSFNVVQGSVGLAIYDWDFGDGGSSSLANPCHNYSAPGFYDVTLNVLSNFNCRDTITYQIYIPTSPVVSFSPSDSNGCIGLNLLFLDSTTTDSSTSIQSWDWNFGNGDVSNLQNPSTIYNVGGLYTAILQVTDSNGCVGVDSTDIDVFPLPLIVGSSDTIICVGDSMQLSASGGVSYSWSPNYNIVDTSVFNPIVFPNVDTSYIVRGTDINGCPNWDTVFVDVNRIEAFFNVPSVCLNDTSFFTDLSTSDGTISSWSWDFGEPISGAANTSILQNPQHFYLNNGTYNATLSVTDDNTCSADTIIQVFVSQAPIASAVADSVCFGLNTNFNSALTSNGGANIIEYFWDFGVVGALDDTAIIANPTFNYPAPGLYTVTFSVLTDQICVGNNDDTTFVVEVFALPPLNAGLDTIICFGDSAQLNATGALSYAWTPNVFISDTSLANPIVFPGMDTTYIVQGVDSNACVSIDTVNVTVNNLQANFIASTECFGDTTQFTDVSISDQAIVSWTWNFDEPTSGANDSSILQNPAHFYLTADTFNVSLTIEDGNMCTSDTIIPVVVADVAVASFIADSVCFGQTTTFNSSGSFDAGDTIISYAWDFGDPLSTTDVSTLPNPTFTYAQAGTYTVCLTITTSQLCPGNFDDTCFAVQVYELPTAAFNVDSSCLGNANNFLDISQTGINSGIATSTWNFGQNPGDSLEIIGSPASTTFLYDTSGVYNVSLTLVDSNLCSAVATETVFVFDNPSTDFSFSTACQNQDNDFVSLPVAAASNNLSYFWDFDEGAGFIAGDSIESYSFNFSGIHTISHVVVDAFGCSDTAQQVIVITDAPSAIITGDNTICRGLSTILSGASSVVSAPPAIYNWSVTTSQTSTITYSPSVDTRVFLTVTDGNGCFDTTSVLVDVLQRPDADFDWSDACEDIPVNINSTSSQGDAVITAYQWDINSNTSGSANFATQNVVYNVPTLDTLSVTLVVTDANNCLDSITQVIIVDEQVSVQVLTPDFRLCPGDAILINLNDPAQFIVNGLGAVLWSPPSGVSNITGDSITLSPSISTTYTITAFSVLNQCPPDANNIINVDVAPDPFITIDAVPNPVLAGAISNISTGVNPFNINTDSLIWDNSSGTLNTDFGFNLEATPLVETTYPVQLIYYQDTLRCEKDTAITIFVIEECSGELIYIPNIFTPNDDGKNDEFKLTGYGIEVINYLRVFDRWGQLMFEGNDIEMNNGRMNAGTGWLGDNQGGKDCNSGVYVYSYELICANGDIVRGSGNVTLIK